MGKLMNAIRDVFNPTRGDDRLREVDAYLYRLSSGRLGDDERQLLQRRAQELNLTPADLQGRLDAVLAKKEEARKAAAEESYPAFTDAGVILDKTEPADRFLAFGETPVAGAFRVDRLLSGDASLPDLAHTRWHKLPGESEAGFEHLLQLLSDVSTGRIRPGHCAILFERGDRLGGTCLQAVEAACPPLGMAANLSTVTLVRHPSQTEKRFGELTRKLREVLEAREAATNMRPAAVAGGRW